MIQVASAKLDVGEQRSPLRRSPRPRRRRARWRCPRPSPRSGTRRPAASARAASTRASTRGPVRADLDLVAVGRRRAARRRPGASSTVCGGREEPQRDVALRDLVRPRGPGRSRGAARRHRERPAETARSRGSAGRSMPREPGGARPPSRSCQRTPVPPISSGGEAGVERDLGGDRLERLRGGVDAGLVAEAGRELGEDLPDRADLAGAGDGGRSRCRRPSGWVTVPSFSA